MVYIEKEPIIEFITKGLNNPDKSEAYGYDAVEILSEIEYTPIADVVEVVRCKDCKHLMKDIVTEETPYGFDEDRYVFGCRKFFESSGEWVDVMLDDYCSSGERRKGDG